MRTYGNCKVSWHLKEKCKKISNIYISNACKILKVIKLKLMEKKKFSLALDTIFSVISTNKKYKNIEQTNSLVLLFN